MLLVSCGSLRCGNRGWEGARCFAGRSKDGASPPGGHQCVAPLVFLCCGNPGAIILNLQSSQENLPKETSEGFGPENVWMVR